LLTGSIPSSLSSLSLLEGLFLDSNRLTGYLPSELGSLSNLQLLRADLNMITGTIPTTLAALSLLNYFMMNDNMLRGPVRLVGLPALLYLDLSTNELTGSIPGNVSPSLGTFNVAFNSVSGSIPTAFGSSPNFHNINVSNTRISKFCIIMLCLLVLASAASLVNFVCALRLFVAGVIPSEFCASSGASIDVQDTNIRCYSGCLTSSAVLVTGASPNCHDGSIMHEFLVVVGVVLFLSIIFSLAYRFRHHLRPVLRAESVSVK
jgi:hypothetical protein